jgi:hypothetical protein
MWMCAPESRASATISSTAARSLASGRVSSQVR